MTLQMNSCENVHTPLVESIPYRPFAAGHKVYLKLENCQAFGSFELRSIWMLCQHAQASGFTQMVCASSGNIGLATAFCAEQLGMQCHVVVIQQTPVEMCDKLRAFGATVELFGDNWNEAYKHANKMAKLSKVSLLVNPFNNQLFRDAYSSIIDEIADDLGQGVIPSMIVICLDNGELPSGIVQGIRRQPKWADQTKLLVMETAGEQSFHASDVTQVLSNDCSDQQTPLEDISEIGGICEQIKEDLQNSKPALLSRVTTDRDALEACVRFANDHQMIVSIESGASLAALYQGNVKRILTNNESEHERIFDKLNLDFVHSTDGPVVVILSGSAEIDLNLLMKLQNKL